MEKYLHCLRVQIVPGKTERARIENVADFCEKFGFGNVMLFLNAEEFCQGHMTKEEAAPLLETMKRAKTEFVRRGLTVSLNPWIEIGHLDRCRPLKPGQNFTTMVDCDGVRSESVACPLSEEWKKYYLDFYRYIISELEPDTVWVEDDFRLHNHAPLHYGGCFCELHMKRFNEKLGTNYSREEFTDLLFRKTCDEDVKRAFLDVNRETMRELAESIGRAVHDLGLGTKVGLMSSMHQRHAMEGRDWHGVHAALAQGGEVIDRLHLPCYAECGGKEYAVAFNGIPYLCRALLPKECKVYPELENSAFSTFAKDPRFLAFQVEAALPLAVSGMTYDIYDFVGNGTLPSLGYGEALAAITPYMNGVLAEGIAFDRLEGVVLPMDEKTSYRRTAHGNIEDFSPDEWGFYSYLTTIGAATRPTAERAFKGKTVALAAGTVRNFTDDELRAVFRDGRVVLEGGAALELKNRGLLSLIGAEDAERVPAESTGMSFEKAFEPVGGIEERRASAFAKAGDYVKIKYRKGAVKLHSATYDYRGTEFGAGAAEGANFFVIPWIFGNCTLLEQYNDLRVLLLTDFLKKGSGGAFTDRAAVCCYRYRSGEKRSTVLVVNFTVERFDSVALSLSFPVRAVSFVDRDGKIKKAKFERADGGIRVRVPLDYLSTACLVLEEE